MALKIDIKQGSSITRDKSGWRIERVAIVTNVLGEPSSPSASAAMYQAITDGLLPALGDPHPSIATVYLDSLNCEPLGNGRYRVRMSYSDERGFPAADNIAKRVSASTAPSTTGVDKVGNNLSTVYQTQNDIDNSWFSYEFFDANIERPRATFDFEYTVSGAFPQTLINTYLGKLNSVIWNGYAIKTVMCSNIMISPQGDDWRVAISFVHNPDGWEYTAQIATPVEHVVNWTDVNLDTTTGRRDFEIYQTVDFTALGLTL